jgi:hypothetical protein
MAAHYQRKLKNFFIKKDFQGRISLAVFLAVVGGCFIFFVLLAFFSRNTLTFSYTDSVVQVGQTPWMLIKNALLANWLFLRWAARCWWSPRSSPPTAWPGRSSASKRPWAP